MWIYKDTSFNCVTEKLLISDILILTVLLNYNRDFVIFEFSKITWEAQVADDYLLLRIAV